MRCAAARVMRLAGGFPASKPRLAALIGEPVANWPIFPQSGMLPAKPDKPVAMLQGFGFSLSHTSGKTAEKTGETNLAAPMAAPMAAIGRNDAFVVFDHVQKSYDGVSLVVKDLNLSIAKGEFLTMLGPSGSGKTTCLMMLAGFETATNGEILLDGRPINQVPPHKRGHRDGVPELRAVSAYDGGRKPGLSAGSAGHGQVGARREDQARAGHGADGRFCQPSPGATVGRAAAAHRAGAGVGVRPQAGA